MIRSVSAAQNVEEVEIWVSAMKLIYGTKALKYKNVLCSESF